jgi:hypothetical protein
MWCLPQNLIALVVCSHPHDALDVIGTPTMENWCGGEYSITRVRCVRCGEHLELPYLLRVGVPLHGEDFIARNVTLYAEGGDA